MDFPLQDVQAGAPRGEPGVRPRSETTALDAFIRAEENFFHVAPLAEVEDHLQRLQAFMQTLAQKARTRRQSDYAERCAVCKGPWKLRLPDGGRVPHGVKLWHMEDNTTMNLYACDAACYSKLEFQVEKRTFEIRQKRDDEKVTAQREYAAKRARR